MQLNNVEYVLRKETVRDRKWQGILDRVEDGENEHNFIRTCVPLIEHPDETENCF